MINLNYHEVVPEESSYSYSISAGLFQEHVRLIASRAAGRPPVKITFDDGAASQYRYGLPALEKHGVKAIFFVTAGWTGNAPDAMDWGQLRELLSLGHEVGAHGWSHKFLTQCSPEELRRELLHARLELQDRAGCRIDALSLPNGRWNRRVLEASGEYGYRRVFGSYPWFPEEARSASAGMDLQGRRTVMRNTTGAQLIQLVEEGPRRLPRLKYSLIRSVRTMIGEDNYHRLWCLLARRDPEAEGRRGIEPMP